MKSPFPGMDPYLELSWGDVSHCLATYASEALNQSLPFDLVARINEHDWLEDDPICQPFIEIRVLGDGQVVTVIEYISPANKFGEYGTLAYRKTREEHIAGNCNLVEIDLVRAGDWASMLRAYRTEFMPPDTTYRISVCRAGRHEFELYTIAL